MLFLSENVLFLFNISPITAVPETATAETSTSTTSGGETRNVRRLLSHLPWTYHAMLVDIFTRNISRTDLCETLIFHTAVK